MAKQFLIPPQIPTLSALPGAGAAGALARLNSDGRLYHDNGSAWKKIVEEGTTPTFTGATILGNLGIGTAPITQLHVAADGATLYPIFQQSSPDPLAASYLMRKSRGTVAAPGTVQNGDQLSALLFQGWDGTQWINGAAYIAFVDGTVSTGGVPGNIIFYSGGLVQALKLTSDSRVVIGAHASANGQLDVKSAHASLPAGIFSSAANPTAPILKGQISGVDQFIWHHKGWQVQKQVSANPTATDIDADHLAIYLKGGKLCFARNDAGTMRFLSIALDGGSTTFSTSTP
jgi:hypothetical protein